MANTLTAVTPKLLAQGLLALRQNAIMPRLVNRQYETIAGQRGSTIDVPIPSAIAAQNVSPGATPPSTADIAPTSVAIPLDQWIEAAFFLTDKDIMEAMEGTIPMQASEAIKSLANAVDNYILAQYVEFYSYAGTAGSTPFAADTSDATTTRKFLNKELAPLDPRHFVLNPDAEANALNLRAFQDASWVGSVDAIIQGQLNQRLGFNWWMDQNIPTHTKGAAASYLVNNSPGPYALGTKLITVDGGTGKFAIGDIVTFAGDTQTYVITAHTDTDPETTITIRPGLRKTLANDVAITSKGTHVVNLAFHRDAIALATRPLADESAGLGVISQSAVDPISGLTLRLEITHEHKRRRFSYDILYGAKVIRPELGARLAG